MTTDDTRFLGGARGARRFGLAIGLVFVLIGLVHNTPAIPGLDDAVSRWAGNPTFSVRKFPYEWLYPLSFTMMMIIVVCAEFRASVSLRSACDMRRAWSPTWESPISPSSSARGVSAATESTTIRSIAPVRTSVSVISSACSP